MRKMFILLAAMMVLILAAACASPANPPPSSAPSASPTLSSTTSASPTPTSTATHGMYQLAYLVLDNYPNYFWCDPDYYPIGRPGGEEANSLAQFPMIQANAAEFSTILERLNLPNKPDYTDSEKLSIYREHKKLTLAMQITPQGSNYQFVVRLGQNQGFRITGTITPVGLINEISRETSFNTCPICLTKGTLIDTPKGAVPVEQLQQGMIIWTQDSSGKRVEAEIIKTSLTAVPPSFEVVKITLSDGRSVTASPGHPTADLKALGDYKVGDMLDGSQVTSAERLGYDAGAIYDVLPAGETGLYWANGVLLLSTLK